MQLYAIVGHGGRGYNHFGAVGGGWVGFEEDEEVVQFYGFLYEETKQWRLKVVDLILLRLGKLSTVCSRSLLRNEILYR